MPKEKYSAFLLLFLAGMLSVHLVVLWNSLDLIRKGILISRFFTPAPAFCARDWATSYTTKRRSTGYSRSLRLASASGKGRCPITILLLKLWRLFRSRLCVIRWRT